MRRWNGWGDEKTEYHLPESAARYLSTKIGPGDFIPDASLPDTLSQVPESALKPTAWISTDPLERLMHARGQSLPDWVALRQGRVGIFPDGVAMPESDEDVRRIIHFARQNSVQLIPYGGGTSVVGHINPLQSGPPILTVDLSRFNRLENLDESSLLAEFGAGINGPALEKTLNGLGLTLGHFPQSFELSTLGGWIATRSSGQQSYYFGRIEDLFAGGHVETGFGPLDLPPFPASAAGPDLRHLVLGSEGRIGILTRAVVRVRRTAENEHFYGIFFHTWEQGVQALRQLAQDRVPISMARLSNPQETETMLRLSGKDRLVEIANAGLQILNYTSQKAMLVLGVTGSKRSCKFALGAANEIARSHGGLYTGQTIGKIWQKSRFLTPYLRNTLWERGYAIDTLETALPWSQIGAASEKIPAAIGNSLAEFGEKTLVFAHLSHIYRDGASLYVTFIFRRTQDPEAALARWSAMKTAASQQIVSLHGTISHQHGVGVDHAPYLAAEKGETGMRVIENAMNTLDPEHIFNPGKLIQR